MSTSTSQTKTPGSSIYEPTPYKPRYTAFPYTEKDFKRADESSDTSFYSSPRFVTHIDDAAIESLARYYEDALPKQGRILDFCSSWVSHYPKSIHDAAASGALKVVGLGLNQAELDANTVLNGGRTVMDLNKDPVIPDSVCRGDTNVKTASAGDAAESGPQLLDASTCVVSIDYLTRPVEVLDSLRERTKIGGTIHLAISNRCFPTKVIARWLKESEEERLLMVCDFLWFAGWQDIEIIDAKATGEEAREQPQEQGGLKALMGMIGMGYQDPLWIVRARRSS